MPLYFFSFCAFRGSLSVFPNVEDFVFEGNSLGVVLTELCPLLRQSINWFEGLVRERGTMSEVRSSELDTRLSSSGEPVEGDIAVSTPQAVRAFYALKNVCGLDADTVGRFRDRFQFSERFVFVDPMTRTGLATFFPMRYASMP